ncbi:MAG: thioredoxin family protein [Bacteroidetes bacterium]|nr:thioredoxin family protein [Bacteroidota bacterium]
MSRITMIVGLFFVVSAVSAQTQRPAESPATKARITFVELGSVNCIPCRKMQPVMKAIEQKYGASVDVIFYDVWTEEHKPFAKKYGVRLIPTQVFLDEHGKEFFRHEGFFPEEEIHKLFRQRGLVPVRTGG